MTDNYKTLWFDLYPTDFNVLLKFFQDNFTESYIEKIEFFHMKYTIKSSINFKSISDYNFFMIVFSDTFEFGNVGSMFWSKSMIMTKHQILYGFKSIYNNNIASIFSHV